MVLGFGEVPDRTVAFFTFYFLMWVSYFWSGLIARERCDYCDDSREYGFRSGVGVLFLFAFYLRCEEHNGNATDRAAELGPSPLPPYSFRQKGNHVRTSRGGGILCSISHQILFLANRADGTECIISKDAPISFLAVPKRHVMFQIQKTYSRKHQRRKYV